MKQLKDFEFLKIDISTIYGGQVRTIANTTTLNVLQEQNTDDSGDDNDDEY